jgi:hypothetical protein
MSRGSHPWVSLGNYWFLRAAPGVAGIMNGDDEAAVRGALLASALSFEKNDLAMASKIWANDESLTVFESGHANYG